MPFANSEQVSRYARRAGFVAALAIAALGPPFLRALFFYGFSDELIRARYFVLDGTSLFNAATFVAFVVTIASYRKALRQTEATNEQIELLRETTPLLSTRDVLDCFIDYCSKRDVEELYIAAATVSIGATGAPERFTDFKHELERAATKLGSHFHAAYALLQLEEHTAAGVTRHTIDNDSIDRIKTFYQGKRLTDEARLNHLVRETEHLHTALLLTHAIDYKGVAQVDAIAPHFIALNPERNDRRTLIWIIDPEHTSTNGGVVTAGFATTNKHVTDTMVRLFNKNFTASAASPAVKKGEA